MLPTPAPAIVGRLQTFAAAFAGPTVAHPVDGTILAPGRRTVAAALRAVGLRDERRFTGCHRVRNRAVWSPLRVSRLLLGLIVATLLGPEAPVMLLIDATLVRRTGRRIAHKGRLHDAVRSQQGHTRTSEGGHWLCLAVLVPVPWSGRPRALPSPSVPTLTPATGAKPGGRHRSAPERADALLRLVRRWQPGRQIVVVGDGACAVLEPGHTCRSRGMRPVSRRPGSTLSSRLPATPLERAKVESNCGRAKSQPALTGRAARLAGLLTWPQFFGSGPLLRTPARERRPRRAPASI